ncbi:hypothetical protein [Corynebacterium sp.]|uniref:hypothetical protein n=1 Tax=Corynebacterium sp. TaxID=1720 RepID=UPI0026DC6C63|nr:hypothetical protein [Corynebacterium sp.]MDO4610970.1 hypothetical protein [Corynebacterium sp.]
MTTPPPRPCSWPVDDACRPEGADDDSWASACRTAVTVLWALTGRVYGVCPVEARPCPPGTPPAAGFLAPGPGWAPVIDSGVVRNVPTCIATSCDRSGGITLPGPVHVILGVTVDGDDVDTATITRHGDTIYRAADAPWPRQDLTRESGQPGTWSVRYLRGTPPPAGAGEAVGALAREFHAACHGGRCRLPRRTEQVQRQGVTVTMVSPEDIYAAGATGLTEVDLWIRAVNPHRLAEPSRVWSPDAGVW